MNSPIHEGGYIKILRVYLRCSIIIAPLILSLFSLAAYCGDDYIAGEVAVIFKADIKEEDAVNFVKKFNLEILRKNGFDPPSLHFNIENDVDAFIKDVQKEPIVNSVARGERLEIDGREGTVVRVKFKQGISQKEIEELSLPYRNRRGVIAWRYYRNKAPFMVIKVPAGKEQHWLKIFSGPAYKDLVDNVMLIGPDLF